MNTNRLLERLRIIKDIAYSADPADSIYDLRYEVDKLIKELEKEVQEELNRLIQDHPEAVERFFMREIP